jgi:hypothetical protein
MKIDIATHVRKHQDGYHFIFDEVGDPLGRLEHLPSGRWEFLVYGDRARSFATYAAARAAVGRYLFGAQARVSG